MLKFFHDEEMLIGRRVPNGPQPGDMTWRRANRSTILYVLRHPIYAGAYDYGRSKSVTTGGPDEGAQNGATTAYRELIVAKLEQGLSATLSREVFGGATFAVSESQLGAGLIAV